MNRRIMAVRVASMYMQAAAPAALSPEAVESAFQAASRLSQVDPEIAKILSVTGDGKDDKVPVSKKSGIPAAKLKPSQTTMVLEKSVGMALAILDGKMGDDLGAIIASDGYIMDGHHRWTAMILARGKKATVGGYVAKLEGEKLVRVLNILTKGHFKRTHGNPGKGSIATYNAGNVTKLLEEYSTNGIGGGNPLSPEDVQRILKDNFGSVRNGISEMAGNTQYINKSVASWAPDRVDMPVIEPDEVPEAQKVLSKGRLEWKTARARRNFW